MFEDVVWNLKKLNIGEFIGNSVRIRFIMDYTGEPNHSNILYFIKKTLGHCLDEMRRLFHGYGGLFTYSFVTNSNNKVVVKIINIFSETLFKDFTIEIFVEKNKLCIREDRYCIWIDLCEEGKKDE